MASDLTLQLNQIVAILGSDPVHFKALISHLMSTANDQCFQAEALFNLYKQTHSDSLVLKLAILLQSSSHPEARAVAAILLRKQLTRDDSYLWPNLSATTQVNLKSILLDCVQCETVKTI